MRGVVRKKGMLLEVNEGPGELNQRLIKAAIFVLAPQPKMLQHVVSIVEVAGVETMKVGAILSGKQRVFFDVPFVQPSLEAFVFFHSRNGRVELQSGCLKNQTVALFRLILIQLFEMSPRKEPFSKAGTLFISFVS